MNATFFSANFKFSRVFKSISSLRVSRVLKYPRKCLEDLKTFFMSDWWGDFKNMKAIEFSRWLFELPAKQHSQFSPSGSTLLPCLTLPRENSISSLFLESPHQVDMKNVVKSSKHFFGYFNTLETHSVAWLLKHYFVKKQKHLQKWVHSNVQLKW